MGVTLPAVSTMRQSFPRASSKRTGASHASADVFASIDRAPLIEDPYPHLVVEDVYTGPRQHQGYIEPRGCVVWIDEDGTVQVVTTCKGPLLVDTTMTLPSGSIQTAQACGSMYPWCWRGPV